MLYFRFNVDKYIVPKQTVKVTEYEKGEEKSSYEEIREVSLGDIELYFFKKLKNELKLTEIGCNNRLSDIIEVPYDAFGIDDEKNDLEEMLKFVLMEYSKLPIQELDNKSLQDLGIEIEFCKNIKNVELNKRLTSFLQSNNLIYIGEKVLWKKMTDDEKANTFSIEFQKIGTENNELIIIDPYLFSTDDMTYCNLLGKIIQKSKAKLVIVVTDKRHYKEKSLNVVKSKINIPLEEKFSEDFHDRFWISNRTKGFCTGTSLNGVGKRISLINVIEDDDIKDIVEELKKQHLI